MENWSWDQNSMEIGPRIKIPWKLVLGQKFPRKLVPGPKFLVGMQTAEQTIATDLMLAMSKADYIIYCCYFSL